MRGRQLLLRGGARHPEGMQRACCRGVRRQQRRQFDEDRRLHMRRRRLHSRLVLPDVSEVRRDRAGPECLPHSRHPQSSRAPSEREPRGHHLRPLRDALPAATMSHGGRGRTPTRQRDRSDGHNTSFSVSPRRALAWRDRDHPRRFLALFRVPVRLARRRHRRQHRRHVRRSVRSLRSRAAWRPLVLQKSRTVGWATRANRLPRLVSSRAVARASSSLTFWSSGTLGAPAHGRPVMAQASNGWRTTLRPAVATWLPR